jgi:methylated-DNA-[protein]-cysteine S-methyltransferase
MRTTPFRKQVWEIMLQIPYGRTLTYGEIADKIAKKRGIKKMSAQAVGGAVGHNSISLIIPCHRVIGSDGNLTGYAGGIKTKIKLLDLEGIQLKESSPTSR